MENGTSPYTEILKTIGHEGARQASAGALQMYLGVVTQAAPLELTVCGATQRAVDGNLWCDPALLPETIRKARLDAPLGTVEASVNCPTGTISQISASGSGSVSGTLTLTDYGFAVGDTLLLLSPDRQTFYILCKEVRL